MKKSTLLIYIGYYWTKTLLGIAVRPYLSVKETMRRPILLPVIFAPIAGLIFLFIASKIGSLFIFIDGNLRGVVALFLSTTLLTIVMWQLLLLYLLVSFLIARIKN
jgi:hypothetical protein